MLIESRKQEIYASHRQFYIEDTNNPGDIGADGFWTDQALDHRLAVIPGVIGIGTGSYGFVDVTTEIHDQVPAVRIDDWDHVAEADIDVTGGQLVVKGCMEPDEMGEMFSLAIGHYRVRCCHANLAESVEFGDGQDWYLVQIWPAAHAAPCLLKRAQPRV